MKTKTRQAAFFGAAYVVLAATQSLYAQLPATRLVSIFPAGANPGTKVGVTISGTDLDDVDKLQFSHAGIVAKQKMAEPGPFDKGPQPVADTFEITVAADVPPGRYAARAIGKYGMSNPRVFTVGTLPELLEAEPNNAQDTATAIEKLPLIVNGQSHIAGDVDFYKVTATAGQRILISCFARRIDSRMEPVITIYDGRGRELHSVDNQHRGEALVDFTAPAAGEYFVKINDAVYQGSNEYFYRLSIGVLPHIDFIFPPAAIAGDQPFTVYGRNLPGGQAAGISIDGRPLQKVNATISISAPINDQLVTTAVVEPEMAGVDVVPYQVKSPAGASNIALVGLATATPINEQEPNDSPTAPQKLSLPCEVQGQFFPKRDRDWFEFEAKKDEIYTIEVISHRLGLPTNPSIIIQQVTTKEVPGEEGAPPKMVEERKTIATVQGNQINRIGGAEFDARTADPVHSFKVPADGRFCVLVRDSQSTFRADPRNVYRLAIRPQKPDFRLVAIPNKSYASVLLRKDGRTGIHVGAFRRDGFKGDITVSATGLPAGVTCPPVVIGGERNSACLILSAAADAAPATGLIQVSGKSRIGNADVTRVAGFGTAITSLPLRQNNQPRPSAQARLARNLAVSISATESEPVAVGIGNGKVYETSRAGILKIPYTRTGSFKGKINALGIDLPPNVELKAFAIDPNVSSGEFPIKLKNNTPTGTYTICLFGIAEKVKYARNPEAAAAAAERKKEIDKINAAAAANAKAATDAKTAADKMATDTAAAAKAAADKKTAADKAATAAMNVTKDTADKAAQAKSVAAAKPDDANLAAAATAAQQAAADATAKLKVAQDAVAAVQKALDEADAKAKAAADAKTKADKAAVEATARAKATTDLKAATDKRATDLAAAAKPTDRNVPIVSSSITIKIAPAPITLAATQPTTPLKQGEKIEIPVSITRLFGFAEEVTVTASVPNGIAGISIPKATVAKEQNTAKLTITAAANATEGQHMLAIRAALKLNNQDLVVEQSIAVDIQKVEKPAQ
ncbi:MAG: PPC domain-containing protein [Pirellulales bacterium]